MLQDQDYAAKLEQHHQTKLNLIRMIENMEITNHDIVHSLEPGGKPSGTTITIKGNVDSTLSR